MSHTYDALLAWLERREVEERQKAWAPTPPPPPCGVEERTEGIPA